MNQSGDFAYTMVNEFMSMANPGDFFRYKGYSHYLFAGQFWYLGIGGLQVKTRFCKQ